MQGQRPIEPDRMTGADNGDVAQRIDDMVAVASAARQACASLGGARRKARNART